MRLFLFMIGVSLLLTLPVIPIGCLYVETNGPTWLRPVKDGPKAVAGSAAMLFVLCGFGAFAAFGGLEKCGK